MAGGDGGATTPGREDIKEKKKAARLAMMELANMISVPMSLHAVVRLNVPDAVYQSGLNAPLTAAEILARLEAVLDPRADPFARANGGVPAYAYYGKDPKANALMQRAMTGVSEPFMEALLDHAEAERGGGGRLFDGVEKLVDVGGSSGACLNMIMRRVPAVTAGVNFDLPDVVAQATEFPGITHVGGDMFKSIPSGDAIFMKWILTTWTDEECGVILKNCHDALPRGGKLIVCEPVLPEETDDSRRTRALLEGDIFVMTIYRAQGRERTEEEFRRLGSAAGFSSFRATHLDHFYTVMELHK